VILDLLKKDNLNRPTWLQNADNLFLMKYFKQFNMKEQQQNWGIPGGPNPLADRSLKVLLNVEGRT